MPNDLPNVPPAPARPRMERWRNFVRWRTAGQDGKCLRVLGAEWRMMTEEEKNAFQAEARPRVQQHIIQPSLRPEDTPHQIGDETWPMAPSIVEEDIVQHVQAKCSAWRASIGHAFSTGQEHAPAKPPPCCLRLGLGRCHRDMTVAARANMQAVEKHAYNLASWNRPELVVDGLRNLPLFAFVGNGSSIQRCSHIFMMCCRLLNPVVGVYLMAPLEEPLAHGIDVQLPVTDASMMRAYNGFTSFLVALAAPIQIILLQYSWRFCGVVRIEGF